MTTDSVMHDCGIEAAYIDDDRMVYEISLLDAIQVIERNGRSVQPRYKRYADDHTDDRIVLCGNARPWVSHRGVITRMAPGYTGWILRRMAEIVGGWYEDDYRGDYCVSYGTDTPGSLTTSTCELCNASYYDTLDGAMDARKCHLSMGRACVVYRYDAGCRRYVEIDG